MIPLFDPVWFYLPWVHFPIHGFGVLVGLGILLGVPLVVRRGKQLGLESQATATLALWAILSGFLFAHVFDLIAYQPSVLVDNPLALFDLSGGLSSFGGFVGALLAGVIWCRVKKQSLLVVSDASVYGFATGWFFGRLGCFSAHDHPGLPTNFFLGVQYPDQTRHDLGLYEALFTLLLVIAFRIWFRKPRRPGFYIVAAMLSYAPVRFGLDFIRVADERYFGLTPAQYGSLVMFACGLWIARRISSSPAAAPGGASTG